MSKMFTAALAATALVGAGVLAQSVTTSASTDIVGREEAVAASAPAAPVPLAVTPAKSALAAQAPSTGGQACYTESGEISVPEGSFAGTVVLPGYDASNGPLVSVTVTSSVGIASNGEITNNTKDDGFFSVLTLPAFFAELTGPEVDTSIRGAITEIYRAAVPAFTTVTFNNEFGSGADAVDTIGTTAPYEASTVSFDLAVGGQLSLSVPKDADSSVETPAVGKVSIEYCYTTPASIAITKVVESDPGVVLPTFNFVITCQNGFTQERSISGAGTVLIEVSAANAPCEVSEVAPSSGSWVAEVGGVCSAIVSEVQLGETATITNRLWSGAYDLCTPL